jgi:uncharacterized membrane protein YdjX (TVP38/TMEM64 family)
MKELLLVAIIGGLFLAASYLTVQYADSFKGLIALQGRAGMFFYVLLSATAVVVAPISTLPLVPVASVLWGSFIAALLTIAGWTAGSFIAFVLSQRYGRPLVARAISMERIDRLSSLIPERNLFWSVVFLRIVLPVEVVSYAVGLFTKMHLGSYVGATVLGITPFAFGFAYAVKLPMKYQFVAAVFGLIILYASYRHLISRAVHDMAKPVKV